MPATRARRCGVSTRAGWACSPGSPRPGLRCMVRRCGGRASRPRRTPRSARSRTGCRTLLNLHGPSLPLDTMCSSSLTAIHLACEHLLARRVRAGAGRRREPVSASEQLRRALRGSRCSRATAAARASARAATAMCRAKASGWCCSSRCRRRSRTATTSTAVIRGSAHQPWRQDQRLHGAEPAGAEAS